MPWTVTRITEISTWIKYLGSDDMDPAVDSVGYKPLMSANAGDEWLLNIAFFGADRPSTWESSGLTY